MERFGPTFLIAGVITFLLGFFLQGLMPVITLRKMKVASVEEIAAVVTPEFIQLADDYPKEFGRYFGQRLAFARALTLGKQVYMSRPAGTATRSSSARSRTRTSGSARCRGRPST
jgi:hypothetical protein